LEQEAVIDQACSCFPAFLIFNGIGLAPSRGVVRAAQ